MRTLALLLLGAAVLAQPARWTPSATAQTPPAVPSRVQNATAPPAPPHAAKLTRHRITGEVVSVDAPARTVSVKTTGTAPKELTFSVAGKAASALSGLHRGDRIDVSYTERSGHLSATSIRRSTAKTKA